VTLQKNVCLSHGALAVRGDVRTFTLSKHMDDWKHAQAHNKCREMYSYGVHVFSNEFFANLLNVNIQVILVNNFFHRILY
jgi:hypothetical protein